MLKPCSRKMRAAIPSSHKENKESSCSHFFSGNMAETVRKEKAFPSTEASLSGKCLSEKLVCDMPQIMSFMDKLSNWSNVNTSKLPMELPEMSWEKLEGCGLPFTRSRKKVEVMVI